MRWKPNSTVATIIESDGKFLFVEEYDQGKIVFNQPAGHLDEGESLESAALRETLEETGHTCKLTGYLGLYIYTAPSNNTTYHRHCFTAQSISYDANAALDDGIIGIRWLSLDELKNSNQARSPLVIKCAEDYLQRTPFPLHLIYEHNHE